jgi:hypothetical protein
VKETLEAINNMQADGVIGQYAIGEVRWAQRFTWSRRRRSTWMCSSLFRVNRLARIYEHLKARGGRVQDEYIVIADWPVQFLLPANELERAAIAEAVETDLDGVPTRVMSAEHLVAIALRVGRAKDHSRILQFLEHGAVHREKLQQILEQSGLTSKWREFERRFLEGST